jgi:hypothetical protein
MLFNIGEQVFLNGNIVTNRYPRGDMGVNDIKTIFVNNLRGIVYSVELPNLLNSGQFLYTIKIFENLYAIEVRQGQISPIQIPINGIYNPVSQPNIFNPISSQPGIKLNSLSTLDQLNQLNKLNWVNNQINQINKFNQNLNTSKQVQKTISKFIYYKLVDEWLYTKLFPILAFVKIVDNVPQLIKSMKEYDINNLSSQTDREIELRVEYLEKNVITKKLVFKVLKRIVKKMCLNWYELDKHTQTIQRVFLEYFKDLFEESIK